MSTSSISPPKPDPNHQRRLRRCPSRLVPDGHLIAFASNRSKPDPDRTYNTDIWVVAANNTDKGAQLTQVTTNPGDDDTPSWSPDGKLITYITQLDPHLFQYATHHVAVSPATGGQAKVLTQSFDRNATEPRFSPDGNSIYSSPMTTARKF